MSYQPDQMDFTPEMVLREALDRVMRGELPKHDKCVVIFLDDEDGAYNVSRHSCGLRYNSIIGLLEIFKAKLLKEMLESHT